MYDTMQNVQARKRANGEGGFTLIELLVVIVILGILAAVAVFAVSGITDRGQASACEADENTVQAAQEAHFASTRPGAYAADIAALVTAGFLAEPSTLHATTSSGAVTPIAPCT